MLALLREDEEFRYMVAGTLGLEEILAGWRSMMSGLR